MNAERDLPTPNPIPMPPIVIPPPIFEGDWMGKESYSPIEDVLECESREVLQKAIMDLPSGEAQAIQLYLD